MSTSLSDYELPTEEVVIRPGASFRVGAISFEDISKIVAKHGPVAALIYQRFTETQTSGLSPETVGNFVGSVVNEFPEAVAYMIATATGEPDVDAVQKVVNRLPVGVQLEAIEKIMSLTFVGEAEVKKLVETVTRMFMGVTGVVTNLTTVQTPSGRGNGSFASK